jgi:hypothetical protein
MCLSVHSWIFKHYNILKIQSNLEDLDLFMTYTDTSDFNNEDKLKSSYILWVFEATLWSLSNEACQICQSN